jgi:hypothetical protein
VAVIVALSGTWLEREPLAPEPLEPVSEPPAFSTVMSAP